MVNFQGAGAGGLKSQFFERKYETKLEFSEGWWVGTKKTLCGRGMDILWNSTMKLFLSSPHLHGSLVIFKVKFECMNKKWVGG